MERRAEVLRTIEVADGEKLKPGTVIGEDVLAGWREPNLHSMVKDGRLRIISESSGDAVELAAQNAAQADRIRELEALLKEHDLMFYPDIHMVRNGKPVTNPSGTFRRKRGSKNK